MATLQQQYNLIKEGKGDKQFFLKSARYQFPDYITSLTDFKSAIHILKSKSILNEETQPSQPKKDWFKIFKDNIEEAIGVKNTKEYGNQNEFKGDKEADKIEKDANFDYKDPKNIDNLYGQTFILGMQAEMYDPKNAEKTVDELKAIVAKNMDKDVLYYTKNAFMGVKGIGYEQPKDPKAPTGKYKSSGYGDMPKVVKESLSEAKRPDIATHMKEVEKTSAKVALEAKLNAIDEAIETRKAKLELSESDDLAEMIDPKMIKTLQKEIKELEKHKAKTQKMYEKMTGSAKEEVIDENANYNLNNFQ